MGLVELELASWIGVHSVPMSLQYRGKTVLNRNFGLAQYGRFIGTGFVQKLLTKRGPVLFCF